MPTVSFHEHSPSDAAAAATAAAQATVTVARMEMTGRVIRQQEWFALANLARDFADGAIHILDGGTIEVRGVHDQSGVERAVADIPAEETTDFPTAPRDDAAPIGWLDEDCEPGRVNLGVGVYGRRLPAAHVDILGALEVPVTVTQRGSLIFHDIAEGDADVVLRVLAPRGFIFDANSPHLDESLRADG